MTKERKFKYEKRMKKKSHANEGTKRRKENRHKNKE